MAKSTTHKLNPNDLLIIGRDTPDGEEHFLYQDRAKNTPTPQEVAAAAEGISGVVEITKLPGYDGYVVVTGRQRTAAAREAGVPEIECKIIKGTPIDLVSAMIKENALQKALTPLEKAKEAKKLLDMRIAEGESKKDALKAVAVSFGQTVQSIKDYLTILDMAPEVHEAIQKGEVSANVALNTLRHVEPEKQAEKLQEAIEAKDQPKVRANGQPAPEKKRNMDKAILRYMANDEGSPLIGGDEDDDMESPDQIALLVLELCHGLANKAEVFRRVPNFKSAYNRARRALKGDE